LSDSEFEDERLHSAGSVEPEDAGIGSERDGSSPIPGAPDDEGSDEDLFEAKEETQDNDDLFDVDLAAELGRAMAEDSSEDAEGESDVPPRPDEEEETDSEEDEDEDEELVEARKLLNEEINDLEAAVAKKAADIAGAVNPLIKVRPISLYDCQFITELEPSVFSGASKTP
jgi:transcription initiation factor TFIID subunit 7